MKNSFDDLDLEIETNNELESDNSFGESIEENHMSIKDFFQRDVLEKFQRSLSKATGLAFVTVDYQGNPITETTFFSKFCSKVRENNAAKTRCKASDAFGALQAAVTHETSIYLCPCGLLEVAIPIMVDGQYLGGFVGGQIRCEDAPENINRFSSAMKSKEADKHALQFESLRNEIPVYEFEKFSDIATMVSIIIGELCENAILQYKYGKTLKNQLKNVEKANEEYAKIISEKNDNINELRLLNNYNDVIDMLTTVYNSSIIDGAKETSDLLSTFIDYYKYTFNNYKEEFVPITSEMNFINNYLLFIKNKYGDKIDFSIEIKKNLNTQKMPSRVLLPFIKNALQTDILLNPKGGKISVNGYAKGNKLVFEIITDGAGLSQDEIISFENYDGEITKLGMEFATNKLKKIYGEKASISVENYKNIGQKCLIHWPELFDEGTD